MNNTRLASGVIVSLALALPLCAQKEKSIQTSQRQLRPTALTGAEIRKSYERRESDGMRVTVFQVKKDNKIEAVNPGQSFKSGDEIKIKFESNFDGYVYVLNLAPSGRRNFLFPQSSSRNNSVRAGQYYDIPPSKAFKFERDTGVEVIQFVMARSRVRFLEAALDAGAGQFPLTLDAGATRKLDALTGKPIRPIASGVYSLGNDAPITRRAATPRTQSRMLTVDSRKSASTLVVSDQQQTQKRLKPGEVSVFEIRLNHH